MKRHVFAAITTALLLSLSATACVDGYVEEEPIAETSQEISASSWTVCGFGCPYGYTAVGYVCDIFCGGTCPYGRYGSTPNATECVYLPPPTPSGSVSAQPENVYIAPGTLGTSRICFEANVLYSEVWVSMDGGPESLFMSEKTHGCSNATWIQAGHSYDFRLYAGSAHSTLLDQVTVTGIAYDPPPDTCGPCDAGYSCFCGDICRPDGTICP